VSRFLCCGSLCSLTIFSGGWGEYWDRRKLWQYAEMQSGLSGVDKEKAWQLQQN
jgi:hypothetical protein